MSSTEQDYYGSLSTLTKYGTLNVSATRVPRKKRSRGNIAQPRTRCIALTDCVVYDRDGNVTRIIPMNTGKGTPRTRKPNRVTVAHDGMTYDERLSRLGAVGDSNH